MRQPKESLNERLEYLQEDIVGLAEDVIGHDRVLDLYAERIYSTEEACFWVDWEWGFKKAIEVLRENQVIDAENLSDVIDVLWCVQSSNKMILDIIIKQNETIKLLSDEVNKSYNGIIFLTVWSLILTVLTVITSTNVFF